MRIEGIWVPSLPPLTGRISVSKGTMKDAAAHIADIEKSLKAEIPEGVTAVAAVSGGIDSTVAAVLANRVIGTRVRPLFVDTGLLRQDEGPKVLGSVRKSGIPLELIDARQTFFRALKGVIDPEEKRTRIGEAFIRVFEQEAKSNGATHLIQGTIAPDWIESGGGMRDTIKKHHNVGGLPKDMRLKVVEPLRDLYKDEVRAIAKHLGVPEPSRQPFPGPGLAVRVLGEVTEERVATLRSATVVVEEAVERAVGQGKIHSPWQYFAVLLPIQSTGVIGDNRTYANTVAVRMVESSDAMSATASEPPAWLLREISERITRELSGKVNRVVYDVTDKPPATIEWE